MARRSGNPALYEMMRSRAQDGSGAPLSTSPRTVADRRPEPVLRLADDQPVPAHLLERIANLLKPGRTLRLPVGYVFLAVGVSIVLLWLTYMIGNSRGYSQARADLEEKFRSQQRNAGVNDPLTLGPVERSSGGSALRDDTPPVRQAGANPPKILPSRPASLWGEVVPKADPRKKGWNYFILAETSPEGARRIVEFCRTNGLETYVVPSEKSQTRRRVAAFPGFQGSQDAPDPIALRDRILEIGTTFKKQNKNAGTDFSDWYYDPFD